ncbi:MAG TPA: ATP-binding protein [Candidatus Acidoferrum sp.]|nr:ATP-binding protein [Candidatus Acidoferrum sp.]
MSFVGPFTSPDEQARMRKRQAELQLGPLRATYLGNVIASAIVATTLRGFAPLWFLCIWVALFVVFYNPAGRQWMRRWETIGNGWRPGEWDFRMAALGSMMAVLWNIPGLLVPAGYSADHDILIATLSIALTSLTTASQTMNLPLCRAYAFGMMVPCSIRFMASGDPILMTNAILAFPYLLYLWKFQSAAYARGIVELRQQIANERLSADLASSNNSLSVRLDEVERLKAASEAANMAKTTFLANMSHELRTPLNAILGFSELLAEGHFANKRTEYAKLIHDSGAHLLMLINDILDLAKIEAGRMVLREVDLDFVALAAECVAIVRAKADAGGIELVNMVDPALPRLRGDERAFKQIIFNLTTNAMKFTPAGGSVKLFGRIDPSGKFVFGVADTGIGIAIEDQARVFESFGQGRHDAIRAEKGTGLGLSIVKGLAEAHDGRVYLESEVGKGTCIALHLPPHRIVRDARANKAA